MFRRQTEKLSLKKGEVCVGSAEAVSKSGPQNRTMTDCDTDSLMQHYVAAEIVNERSAVLELAEPSVSQDSRCEQLNLTAEGARPNCGESQEAEV